MGMIINIDEALKLRSDYNVLKEPLHAMMRGQQEMWEKENPIDFIYNRNSISSFQETYTSSIGFKNAFSETADYSLGPIFNKAEGFAATYRTRTFQGSFIITQQTLEDRQVGKVKDDATQFVKAWHRDIVKYAMAALDAGFGIEQSWTGGDGKVTRLKLTSADTWDGDITNGVKNPLFYNKHTLVKRDGVSYTFNPIESEASTGDAQTNMFYGQISDSVALSIDGSSPNRVSGLADLIDQVITYMENLKDDNGEYAAVSGEFTIVAANDPHLKAAINTALSTKTFCQGEAEYVNPAYERCTAKFTPYLNNNLATKGGLGFFIVNKSYNAENHGLELTERIPFTLDAIWEKRPAGVIYDGRQRFDVNVATWRGIAYVRIGALSTDSYSPGDLGYFLNTKTNYMKLNVLENIVKPVSVEGVVKTKEQS